MSLLSILQNGDTYLWIGIIFVLCYGAYKLIKWWREAKPNETK